MSSLTRVITACLLLAGLAGCAGVEPHLSPRDDDAGSVSTGAQDGEVVRIGLTDWTIETAHVVLHPGEVTILVTNTGGTAHDLRIEGALGVWGTPYLDPGESHELQITVEEGEVLELTCTMTGHRAAGMYTEVTVGEIQEV